MTNDYQYKSVKSIAPDSPASRTIIFPGDALRKINGHHVGDVLDYKFLSYDKRLLLELVDPNGKIKLVRLRKTEGADLGLEFETFLMDKQRACANKCIFCFVDQLPDDMRQTLYYKDDDVRLSFLQGNYVTLTNLTDRDIERIIMLRVSPINVSIHTLDPELRSYMLGTKIGSIGVNAIKALAKARITLNCQIVCCPGVNDGAELSRTIKELIRLGDCINSVSVVPVGLTKHRHGLTPLKSFDREHALKTVRQVEKYGKMCLKKRGMRVFYCSDELYMKAGRKLPKHGFYEEYPQLENGVGMMRLFIKEFMDELSKFSKYSSELGIGISRKTESALQDAGQGIRFSIVTGMAASKYLTKLLKIMITKYGNINGKVYNIRNEFFGESVTVSGLVTGGDVINQLKGRELGARLLIPINMLRSGEEIFLDDVTTAEVSETLNVPIRIVKQDGADLHRAIVEVSLSLER